jgi:hypothetical protein
MIAIVDKKIPQEAKIQLQKDFSLFELESDGIVYSAISGHPDVFFFQNENTLIVAPNMPSSWVTFLKRNMIPFSFGEKIVGAKYPHTCPYNIVASARYWVHKEQISETVATQTLNDKTFIPVKQAYSKCNTIVLREDVFITSDQGIYQALRKQSLDVLYVSPQGIRLPGFEYGFIGGTCGIIDHKVYFIGSLLHYPDGEKLKVFLNQHQYEVVELYDGVLFDGGGILFL